MKIEVGCGEKLSPGYIGCDVRNLPGVDYVCNAWELDEIIKRDSIEEIYSRHFLEHLTFPQVDRTLACWYNILEPGGKVRIIVPDMLFHIEQWLSETRDVDMTVDGKTSIEDRAIQGFWGKQREASEGEIWDFHKSGYDYRLLSKILFKHKFMSVRQVHEKAKNLHVVATK